MKFNLKPLQAALLLAGLSPMAAHALMLPLTADTHLAATAAGSAVAININAGTKALLNFDVATLPAGITRADIAKATLVFYVKSVPTAGQLKVSSLTSAWTEDATLGTAPTATLPPQAFSATISKGNTYFAIDVTSLVQNWIDVPATNFGLALEPLDTTFTSLTIDSKEAVQTSHPAYLDIALNGPVGAKGAKGQDGLQGEIGLTGARGPTGDSGAPGPQGDTGLQGDVGPQGDTGPQGDAGTDAAAAPLHTIGESFGGGKVFYISEGGLHGLIAATEDQGTAGVTWYAGTNTNTLAKDDGVGTGKGNTTLIIASQKVGNGTVYPARLCNEYSVTVAGVTYADWYLPSKYELNLLYLQKVAAGANPPNGYWSSTEIDTNNVTAQGFGDGAQLSFLKNGTTYGVAVSVRAIRAF